MSVLIANFVAFQIGWLACVLGGAQGLPWLGAGIGAAIVLGHLLRLGGGTQEWRLLVVAAIAGTAWDSLLVALGLVVYPSGQLTPWLAPYWITVLWLLFATTINWSLRWLRGRYLLAAMLGAVAGPLAYRAGAALGGVDFPSMPLTMAALALGWAVMMPLLLALSDWLDPSPAGMREPRAMGPEGDLAPDR
jgi:hypothetical protein